MGLRPALPSPYPKGKILVDQDGEKWEVVRATPGFVRGSYLLTLKGIGYGRRKLRLSRWSHRLKENKE